MQRRTLGMLAITLACSAAHAESAADRWNLADLYPSQAAWDADAAQLKAQLPKLAACKGELGASAARLRECLDLRADMAKRSGRLYVFASEQQAQDMGVAASEAVVQRADVLYNRFGETASFFEPELLAIGPAKIAELIAADPGLAIHRFLLEQTLRAAPHTLDAAGEAIVAQFGQMNDAGQTAYSLLANADIPWPKLELATGEEVRLDQTAYEKYRESPDRADRERVMDAFFGAWKTYERTAGALLLSQLKQDKAYAAVRKYPDSISRSLDADNMPVAVIDTLIAQTNANLPTLHRYFRLRAKLLGVEQMSYFDVYPPIVGGDYKFPLAQGKALTLDAVAPLGADYVATLG